jgi:hypothetical protein
VAITVDVKDTVGAGVAVVGWLWQLQSTSSEEKARTKDTTCMSIGCFRIGALLTSKHARLL